MSVSVSFYSYQGKPNVAVKSFSTPVAVKTLTNLITNSRPELSMEFEYDLHIDANYCKFEVDGREQCWFIDSITSFENMYIYNCSLDVLSTFWNDVKGENQLIERSSSLNPNCFMPDTMWKTGKKLSYGIYYSSENPFSLTVDQDEFHNSYRYFLSSVHEEDSAIDSGFLPSSVMDTVNNYGSSGYMLSPLQLKRVFAGLFLDGILEGLSKICRDNPLSGIMSLMMFPFSINSKVRNNSLSDKDAVIKVGNMPLYYTSTPNLQYCTGFKSNSSIAVLDCGRIELPLAFGDFRDYEPYSSYKLFLPFVGYSDIAINDFRNSGYIYIKYFVDLVSGSAVVALYPSSSSADSDEEKRPRLTIPCNIGFKVNLASSDAASKKAELAMRAAATGAMIASTFSLGINPATSTLIGATNSIGMLANGNGPQLPVQANMPVSSIPPFPNGMSTRTYMGTPQSVSIDDGGRWGRMRRGMAISSFMNGFGQTSNLHSLNGSPFSPMKMFSMKPFLMIYSPELNSVSDSEQNTIYGKLVMDWAELNSLTGFIKVTDCNLPMKGMRTDVYNKMIDIMENGFYKS